MSHAERCPVCGGHGKHLMSTIEERAIQEKLFRAGHPTGEITTLRYEIAEMWLDAGGV